MFTKATAIMDAKSHIHFVLKHRFGSRLVAEHKGIPGRKFRFDWAVPDIKLAVEYEGTFSSKSRHLTVGGYAGDCLKYNLCQLEGWKVLRYTALNYKDLSEHLERLES